MKNYKELLSELPSKSVVFTCGRFNPPNVGHELSIKVVRKLASQRKADHFIFVSSVQDAKKNPLEISKKMQYLGSLFPNTKFVHKEVDAIGAALKKYKSVTLVTPADSVEYYKKALKKVGITDVEIVKAGDTCPDEDDKLLKLASKGDYVPFKGSLPTTARDLDGKRLMNDIRIGLNLEPIKEQINLVKDDLREQYFRGELFNEGDIVESDSTVYKIIKRGSNHLLLQNEAGLKVSKWIQDVQLTEREFMLDEKQLQESLAITATGETNKAAEKAKANTEKARLVAKQAEEKAKLIDTQKKQMDNLSNTLQKEDSPVVNTKSKYNIAKSIMSLNDFRKTMKMGVKGVDQTAMDDKETESDLDASEHATSSPSHTHVGGQHMSANDNHSLRRMRVKYHLGEGRDDAYTRDYKSSVSGMGHHQSRAYHADGGANDEGWGNERHKPRSTMDRPHTVHINGKPWKKFSNGHQAHAAARTLQAKGKDAHAIAHFSEETDEQQTTRDAQLKRFKDQAKDSKLTDVKVDEDVKPKTKTVNVDKVHTAGQEPHEEKFETFKEEFDDINEDELIQQVEADLDALTEDSDEFFEAYDDEELAIIDEDTGEEIEAVAEEKELDAPALMEVLSRIERIKAKARMRRSQAKRERREKVALRQLSTPQVANKRARRMAVSALKKRLLRGQNPNAVSLGQKERIERFIQQRRKIVDRLATRMVSRVKQVERARMSHKKFTKPNNGVAF
jgi:hypothetical protein